MNRIHECKYDDLSKKSRTQILREKVCVLEAKLRELENESSLSSVCILEDKMRDLESESSLSAEMHNTLYVVVYKKH